MIVLVTSNHATVLRSIVASEMGFDCPLTDLAISRLIYEAVNEILDIFTDPVMVYTARLDEFSVEINAAVSKTIDEVCRLIKPIDPSLIQDIRLMDGSGTIAVRISQEYSNGAFLRPLREDRKFLKSSAEHHRRQFSTGPDHWYLGSR